jgi:signal transduction histidine kinase
VADQANTERLLLLAPTARDGRLSLTLFAQAGMLCTLCSDMAHLCTLIAQGAGAVMLHEEALRNGGLTTLTATLTQQPVWSDLPIIVLVSSQTTLATSGKLHQLLGSCIILERPVRVGTLLSAVQSALRSRRRQYQIRFLHEAGQLLTASLDQKTLLANVTTLLVRHLADACTVYLVEDGTLQRVAEGFANQRHAQLAATLQQRQPAAPRTAPLWRVIEQQQPDLQEHIDLEALIERIPDPAQQQILAEIGVRSHVLMPLLVRGRATGVLALAMIASGRQFSPADLPFLHEFTNRLAPVIDNLRLYAAEQQARVAAEQATKARDELIAMVSHDLQNPLTTLLGQAQLIRRRMTNFDGDTLRVGRGIEAIERAALHMRSQILTLLDGIRARAGQPLLLQRSLVDMVALIKTVVNNLSQTAHHHRFQIDYSDEVIMAELDLVRMERVLENLLANAVKYSPDGGVIRIRLATITEAETGYVMLQVQDQGIGIPADELRSIFEPFKRAANARDHIEGTGLGLASVWQIVQSHGGQVRVESTLGQGSTFILTLPLVSPAVTAA